MLKSVVVTSRCVPFPFSSSSVTDIHLVLTLLFVVAVGSEAPFLIFQRLQLGVSESEAKGGHGKEATGDGE